MRDYLKRVALSTAVLMAASVSSALPSDLLRLPASEGEVNFPHKKHQGIYQDCIICHEQGPGKIENLGKEWAHITCKGCHQELKKGPVDCTGCHTV